MKNKNKKYIRYTKERAVLSDILPYEIPITFSNRYFYQFLSNHHISLKGDNLSFDNCYSGNEAIAYKSILTLLFDLNPVLIKSDNATIKDKLAKKIPFSYRILHKESDFRELSIIHPKNQLELVEIYDFFKEYIIYGCSISNFSIRKPTAVTKFVFYNDKLHKANKGEPDDFLELEGKEYENLKTFFAYRKYTNIHRFYEDYRYQRAEKKYRYLFKIDISKCFDSIYTHSISWALLSKNAVKTSLGDEKRTLGGRFDTFMQNANHGETNGILIGPEFSRIFAELILQKIDKTVEQKLKNNEEKSLVNRKEYEAFRYVDDYFIFCDDFLIKDKIIGHFRHELKEYKLSLNDAKSKDYAKPMITEISIAKMKIHMLFEKEPIAKISKITSLEEINEEHETTVFDHNFHYYINPNKLAVKFKSIVKESNVEYKDILNYTLAILNSRIEKILIKFDEKFYTISKAEFDKTISDEDLIRKAKLEKRFTEFVVGYLDLVFFLYTVSPRVNSTIKVCHILSKVVKLFKGYYKRMNRKSRFNPINKERVFKKISDDIALILSKHQVKKHAQVEVIYLIVVLKELGKEYRINPNYLGKHFGMLKDNTFKHDDFHLNYFCITTLLFYCGNIQIYSELKEQVIKYIIKYIGQIEKERRGKSTELVLLAMDLLVCPYLSVGCKQKVLFKFGFNATESKLIIEFKKYQKYWFTKWEHFDLGKELNSKSSLESYA